MKRLAIGFAALVTLVFALVLTIWLQPELVIKAKTVRWALHKFVPEYGISFKELNFNNRNLSLFRRELGIEIHELCINSQDPSLGLDGCIKETSVKATLEIGWRGVRLLAAEKIRFLAPDPFHLKLVPSPDVGPDPVEPLTFVDDYRYYFTMVRDFLRTNKPDFVIEIAKFHFEQGDLNLHAQVRGQKESEDLVMLIAKLNGVPGEKSKADLRLAWGPSNQLSFKAGGQRVGLAKLNLDLQSRANAPEVYDVTVVATDSGLQTFAGGKVQVELSLAENRLTLAPKSNLEFKPGVALIHVFNQGCHVVAELPSEDRFDLKLDCPLKVRYPFTYGFVDFDLSNKLRLEGDAANLERGKIEWHSKHQDKYTSLSLDVASDYNIEGKGENRWQALLDQLLPSLAFELKISEVAGWLKSLPEKYTVLPAPFNAMNGPIALRVAKSDDLVKLIQLGVDLKGKAQRVDFDLVTKADFSGPEAAPALDVDFKLKNLALRLPQWNLRDPTPRLFADSRFKKGPAVVQKPKSKTKDQMLELKTEVQNPIRISTNLLPSPLQILLAMDWDGATLANLDVKLLPIKAEFLRRKFEIRALRFQTQAGVAASFIDAEIRFFLPEYTVTAKVNGTSEQPVLSLSSNPPLGETDIYSVLVFGKPASALQGEEQNSLAAARQALATGFFSLTSLYFLGSTPIESIYFDPNTGEATAQVRLDSKSSVSVGADVNDVNRVEVRRSLGQGWYIRGGVKNLDQESEDYGASVEKVISY